MSVMSKLFDFHHRIHTAEQARICRRAAIQEMEKRAWQEKVKAAREENAQAKEKLRDSIRRSEITELVLAMDSRLTGDTGLTPKVQPKGKYD